MTHAPPPEPEFLYVGGDPALDLVNTVDWTSRGPEQDRLGTFERACVRWAEGARCARPARPVGCAGWRRSTARAAAAALAFAPTHVARSSTTSSARSPGPLPGSRPRALQRAARRGCGAARGGDAGPRGAGYAWRWRDPDSDPRALVWPVLWSAADLLRSDEVGPRADLRWRRLRLDVRGPEPQRAPPLVSDANLWDPGENPAPAGGRDLTPPSSPGHIQRGVPNKPRRQGVARSVPRTILFVDPPAFCTTVEALVAPALRTRPSRSRRRAPSARWCSRSPTEARRAGIERGMVVRQALKHCPDLVIIPPNPRLYARASSALHEILRAYAPVIEPRGYGHAFLDLTGTGRLFGPPVDVAARVRREVHERLRFPLSVGVAANKLVSQAAITGRPAVGGAGDRWRDALVVPFGIEAGFLAPHPLVVLPDLHPPGADPARRLPARPHRRGGGDPRERALRGLRQRGQHAARAGAGHRSPPGAAARAARRAHASRTSSPPTPTISACCTRCSGC